MASRWLVIGLIILMVGASAFLIQTDKKADESFPQLKLSPPLFLAGAAEIKSTTAFPENEAGISAYFKISSGINLTQAKTAFASIDEETSSYIKGTVAVAEMTEDEYPYVWVSSDGWIIAYIPRDYKSEALIVPFGYNYKTTTLAEAIKKVCDAIGASFSYDQVGYYHFKFPDATGMVVVLESSDCGSTDEFWVYVNESNTIYNVSWAYYSFCPFNWANLDGKTFADWVSFPHKQYGFFTESEFTKGVDHKVEIHSNGCGCWAKVAIVIIYS